MPGLTAKIQDLEQVAAQPEFWDDPNGAQVAMQELNDCKSHIEQFHQWKISVADAQTALELMEMELDNSLNKELSSSISISSRAV